jgi:hypothetical protein
MNLEAVLDQLLTFRPKQTGGTLDLLLVGHGTQWGLSMPVAATRRAVRAYASNVDLLRGPETRLNKAKKLNVTATVADRLVKKMQQVQGLSIGRVEFRACNLGTWPHQLTSYAEFFGADSAAAPDREDVFGVMRVMHPLASGGNLRQWYTQTFRRLPSWFRRAAKSKEYRHATTSTRMVVYGARTRGNQWQFVGLADSAQAVRAWVGAHLPQGVRYGGGRRNRRMGVMEMNIPIHALVPPRLLWTSHAGFEGAFPMDPKYLKYIIRRRSTKSKAATKP